MREAFAHCRLLPGGAQVVLEDIIAKAQSEDMRIFTFVSKQKYLRINDKNIEIITVLPKTINNCILRCTKKNIPIISSIFDYRNLIIFAPLRAYIMSKQIKKYKPDSIYISSFARSKNIDTYNIPTTLYLHSPMQYIRSHHEEYKAKIRGRKGVLFNLCTKYLKKWDQRQRKYTNVIANSQYTAALAKQIYGLTAHVQYPPIPETIMNTDIQESHQEYFIYAGRLVIFVKELNVIIDACNRTKTNCIIMGDGPDKEKLQKISGNTIIFIPWIHDIHQRISIIQKAKGMINITKESFGISTMEALLLGVPVLGYNQGATTELVKENAGLLIDRKDDETLAHAIQEFSTLSFNRKNIQAQARMLYNTYHH